MSPLLSNLIGLDRPLGNLIERGRENNFDLLRLTAALAVLFGHSFVLTSGQTTLETVDPISRFLIPNAGFNEALHDLAVDIFFVISGFLVARSFLTQKTLIGFIEARALRVFPAAILCTVLTIVGLFWLGTLPAARYFTDPETWQFLINNSTLWRVEFDLPGVFAANAYGGAVNGSLWTLPIELRAYVFLTLLGVLRVWRFRHATNLVLAILVVLFLVPEWSSIVTRNEDKWRLFLFFFAGAAFYINRKYIPIGILPPLVLLALYGGTAAFPKLHALIFVILVSYITLGLALARYYPALDPGRIGDVSYGVYLYAFPVQQALVQLLPAGLNGWCLAVWASLITLSLAAMSWFLVEKRVLTKKGYMASKMARYRR
ncbi:MAG: acyltransferase [Alphaproteobacteria bacterium]|nr:acyltransferase [Alphaproteobacteria bacterium]